jgi:hypothetical protein
MPIRFYFHLVKGHVRLPDRAGKVMPREAVLSPAVHQAIREIWPGTANLAEWEGWSVEIADGNGHVARVIALL